ncbi:MAG: glycosyltransferase family 2 protein [Leptospirales bacterium]
MSEKGSCLTVNETVFAVCVTYNRKDLLLECLEGIINQTRRIDGVILVDNASDDGTQEMLFAQGIIPFLPSIDLNGIVEVHHHPKSFQGIPLIYLLLPKNEGGAGGFHEGIKRSLMEKVDWIWLMDDDVKPDRECLEGQLSFKSISKCIHPQKYFTDGTVHEWEGYISHVTGRRVFQPNISFRKGFSFCTVNSGCFEGMLIHRSIIEKIGLPDKRFFLGMDDTVYGFLAHFHTAVLYARDPRIRKKRNISKNANPVPDRSIYYGMRNTFLVQQYINREIPKYKLIRSVFVLVRFLDYALCILHNKQEKIQSYRVLFRAVRDGISGRFGKGF